MTTREPPAARSGVLITIKPFRARTHTRFILVVVSRSFDSLFRVLFNFPSRYLFAIGLVGIFSLRWSSPPVLGLHYQATRLSRATGGLTRYTRFYGAITLYGQRDNIQYTLRTGSDNTLDRSHTRHRSQPITPCKEGWTAAYALG